MPGQTRKESNVPKQKSGLSSLSISCCPNIYTVIQGNDTESLWTDPMFVDLKNGDYTLKPESPALEMGFNQIILDNFGVQEKVKYLESLKNNAT